MNSFIIAEIADVNPNMNEVAREFANLIESGSDKLIYDFFEENGLLASEEVMKIWYHIRFVD